MSGIAHLYRIRVDLAEPISAGDVTPMMCFPIGEWHSAKYPTLPLTEDLANELIANFEAGVLGTEPVVDSSGKHDTSAPAAGWVKRVYLASFEEGEVTGLALWADVKWTELGASLLTDEQYKYGSVEIGPVVLNESGETVENVLRSLTLTNTPVLRLMPGVQNAAEKQRAVVTLSLSEVTLAEPGSFNALRDALELAIGEANGERIWVCDFGPEWVVYEEGGLDDVSHTYKATYAKTDSSITLGQPVEVKRETTYVPVTDGTPGAASPTRSQAVAQGKAGEGAGAALSEEPAARKGADKEMKTVIQHLKLAEGASESDVLAAVMKLADERDTAVTEAADAKAKLADRDKADRQRDFEAKLAEAMKPDEGQVVHILPGEKETYLKLAEIDHEAALAAIEARVKGPGLKLGAEGSGGEGDADEEKPPDVELAERSRARASKDSIGYAEAERLVLAEDPDLKARYDALRFNPGKEG